MRFLLTDSSKNKAFKSLWFEFAYSDLKTVGDSL